MKTLIYLSTPQAGAEETNGQVEIFNKTIKHATVKQYHYDNVTKLKQHLMSSIMVHNFQKKLKALNFITPCELVLQTYQKQPELFRENPHHKIMGLNIQLITRWLICTKLKENHASGCRCGTNE
jgi:hypothetical protein